MNGLHCDENYKPHYLFNSSNNLKLIHFNLLKNKNCYLIGNSTSNQCFISLFWTSIPTLLILFNFNYYWIIMLTMNCNPLKTSKRKHWETTRLIVGHFESTGLHSFAIEGTLKIWEKGSDGKKLKQVIP